MNGYELIGRNVICEMLIGVDYFPVFCAKEVGATKSRDEIETTHINSGLQREYVPGMANILLNLAGVTHINSGNGKIPITYLLQETVMAAIQTFRMTLTDKRPTPNVVVMTMQGFFKDLAFTGPRGGLSNSSATIRVTGDVEFTDEVPSPVEAVCEVQNSLYIDATPGGTSVAPTELTPDVDFTKVVLIVGRSTLQYTETTGTPTGMQFKYDDTTGIISFDTAIPFNAGEVIFVLYKTIPV